MTVKQMAWLLEAFYPSESRKGRWQRDDGHETGAKVECVCSREWREHANTCAK